MRREDLRHGLLIRLTRTLANPKPDRRYADDWRKQPVVLEGTLFRVRDVAYRQISPPEEAPRFAIHPAQRYFYTTEAEEGSLTPGLFAEVIEMSEPVPESVGTILAWIGNEHSVEADEILAMLVDDGVLTGERIRVAASHVETMNQSEDDSRKFAMRHEVSDGAQSRRST